MSIPTSAQLSAAGPPAAEVVRREPYAVKHPKRQGITRRASQGDVVGLAKVALRQRFRNRLDGPQP